MSTAAEGQVGVVGGSAAAAAAVVARPELFAGEGFEVGLVAGLAASEVERRLAVAMRGGEVCHRALAFYLHDMEERRVHFELGFGTAVDFARQRLGMSKGRARDLLLVGRKLAELPQLDGAFAAGRLSWSKVRRIARVATADTEAAWIARAEGVSHETVEALVAVAKEGEGPRELERGLPATRFVRRLVEDALQYELFEQARAKLEAELGRSVTDGELVQDAIRLFLGSSADGTVPGRRPVDASLFRVAVEEARAAEAGDPAEEAARSDAVLPPRLRRRVLGRDGHRCKVCSSQRHLMIHHVVWRSRGGPTMLDNLVTLCARCHGLVHDGFLGVARRPEGVGFAFTDRKGRPLEGRHPSVAASIAVTACAAAHAAPTATNGVAPLRSEADIPAVVDSAWWRAHEYELEWTARGIRLRRASRRAG